MLYVGISDSQKKVPPLPPSVASRSDSGSGRAFDNGATFLTFNPTVFDGKLPIIDYVITATAEDNSAVTQTVSNLASFVFTGLRSGFKYRYKIRARNSVSESADSAEVGPDTATTVPGRPTSLTAINLSNGGGITLNWIAPPNAGKAITSYTITPTVGAPIVTNSTSTTYSFTGVVGTTYNFTVAATNENGTGLDSTASGTVVPSNPVPITTAAPPQVTQAPPTQNLAFVTLSGTGGVGISSGIYSVSLSFSGNSFTQSYSWSGPLGSGASGNGTAANGFVSQVACNTSYNFTVTLYTGINQSGSSLTQSVQATAPCVGGGPGTTLAPASPTCVGSELSPRGNYVLFAANDETRCVGTSLYETSVISYRDSSTGAIIVCRGTEFGPFANSPSCGGTVTTTTTAPTLTFCPSLGVNVLASGFPGNCPGATVSTTTTAAPVVTTTCSPSAGNECYCACGSGSLSRRTCAGICPCGCVATTTSAPATTTRAPATTTRAPSVPGCPCRDRRGRCVPLSVCLA